MRAAVMTAFGPPSVLEAHDVPDPEPGPGEVLIRDEAAGLNRLDHYVREETVIPEMLLPHILGSDVVGIVMGLGEGVEGFALGDRVVPMTGHPIRSTPRTRACRCSAPRPPTSSMAWRSPAATPS